MRWMFAALFCAAGIVLGPMGLAVGQASAGAQAEAAEQRIGEVSLMRLSNGRQQLRFLVSHPRAGRAPGRARVRVTVFNNPQRNRALATLERPVRPDWDKPTPVALTLPPSARVRDLRSVTIVSYHTRPLALTNGIRRTQTQVVGIVAEEAVLPIDLVPSEGPRLGGAKANFTIRNETDKAVRLTVSPTTCMYDNGNSGSHLSALNDVTLQAKNSHRVSIQADANTGHSLRGQYKTGPKTGKSDRSPFIDPDFANSLYSPSVRNFMFTAINKYTTNPPIDADPQTYNAIQGKMSDEADFCEEAKHEFAVGVNQFLSGTSRKAKGPWQAHAAALVRVKGKDDLRLAYPLFSGTATGPDYPNAEARISLSVTGETLTIRERGASGETPCEGGPDWMSCQFKPGEAKEETPLYNVAFPGSHDSITGSLMSDADWFDKNKSSKQSGAPTDGWCSSYTSVFKGLAPTVYNVSATQRLTISDQLDSGIRYLDLRSAYASSSKMSKKPAWRPLHTMYAQMTVETEAQTIASWAKAHPDEIVIADFNHVCPNNAKDGTDGLIKALQTPDPVTGTSLCDVAFRLDSRAHKPALPTATVRQVRAQGRNVIVLLDGSQEYDADLLGKCGAYSEWDQTVSNAAGKQGDVPINHLWPDNGGPSFACAKSPKDNQSSADEIQAFPIERSAALGRSPTLLDYRTITTTNPNIPFMQAQTQYTLDSTKVLEDASLCRTLLRWEDPFIFGLREYVLSATGSPYGTWTSGKAWRDHLNIVIGDGVNNEYIKTLAEMNSLSTRSCQVTDPKTNPPKYAPCG